MPGVPAAFSTLLSAAPWDCGWPAVAEPLPLLPLPLLPLPSLALCAALLSLACEKLLAGVWLASATPAITLPAASTRARLSPTVQRSACRRSLA